ncbi:MAG TPA: Uma2 family endonuclease [Gemmatimonadales bacterium]|nr:Uma2 family endonuclease [Gemmatimonadales bacterium]
MTARGVREPDGFRHQLITSRVFARLALYLEENPVGQLFRADARFISAPDIATPDIAFIRKERIPSPSPAGLPYVAPDLVVDVLIPGPRPIQILSRVTDWLRAGVQTVWVFEPQRSVGRIYRCDGTEEVIAQGGTITGEEILPGFTCSLTEVFAAE